MIVISDTTAISNLIQINELELLKSLYSRIMIPAAVFDKLMMLEIPGLEMNSILKEDRIEVHTVATTVLLEEIELSLDRGEAEAIVLAIETKVGLLLIDLGVRPPSSFCYHYFR